MVVPLSKFVVKRFLAVVASRALDHFLLLELKRIIFIQAVQYPVTCSVEVLEAIGVIY